MDNAPWGSLGQSRPRLWGFSISQGAQLSLRKGTLESRPEAGPARGPWSQIVRAYFCLRSLTDFLKDEKLNESHVFIRYNLSFRLQLHTPPTLQNYVVINGYEVMWLTKT